MVERLAVNQDVGGSNPSERAISFYLNIFLTVSGRSMKRNNLYVYGGGALAIIFALIWVYTSFFMNGDTVNQLERKAFISHGSDKYEVTILNGNGVLKVYQTVSKVTSETEKGYYFFWAMVNGKKTYVQSPIAVTLIEEK